MALNYISRKIESWVAPQFVHNNTILFWGCLDWYKFSAMQRSWNLHNGTLPGHGNFWKAHGASFRVNTAMKNAVMKLPFLTQVSHLHHATYCACSNDPLLLVVSCPSKMLNTSCCKFLYLLMRSVTVNAPHVYFLLVFSGDAALTPVTLEPIADTSRREKSQNPVFSEHAGSHSVQSNLERAVSCL